MPRIYGSRWETVKTLGEGGQAHTFKVRDTQTDSQIFCALKRLKNVNRLERFKIEVDALRSLSHPNVIKLVDFDVENNPPYFVSELCEGGDLSRYNLSYRNKPEAALGIFIDVCKGVSAAHDEGIVHRDIKPTNILFRAPDGPVVVADFGIAYVEDGERRTLTDEAAGPRNFIAPELEDGRAEEVTPKSNIYSLGKLLYWLISGGRSFSREKHREENHNLKTLLGGRGVFLLEHVNILLDRMINANPYERFDSVKELIREADTVKYLIKHGYSALSPETQLCRYCGRGSYRLVVNQEGRNGAIAVKNFGFTAVSGNPPWRILRCSTRGHIELFQINDWWGPIS